MAFSRIFRRKKSSGSTTRRKEQKGRRRFSRCQQSERKRKTLPIGLQYKVLAEGNGTQPKPTDQVAVNYRGTFLDGTVFIPLRSVASRSNSRLTA